MFGAVVRQLIAHGDGDTLLRLLRDVRGRHVAPTKETYDDIIQFVLGQPDYPIDDVCGERAEGRRGRGGEGGAE